jgi:hypothetical protein
MFINIIVALTHGENINVVMYSRTRNGEKVLAKENHLEELGVDGRTILELIFKTFNWGRGLD